MTREYDRNLDGPRKSKPKTSTPNEQNGTERMPIGNSSGNIVAQNTQRSEEKQSSPTASIDSVPKAVVNYKGSFLDTASLAAFAGTSKYYHRIFREDKKSELRKRAVQQLLQYIVAPKPKDAPHALAKAKAMIKANPDLLLAISCIKTYAADLAGNHVMVEGTAFQLALGAEDEEMAAMIAKYLDEYYPGEKQRQYQAQFPNEEKEEKAEAFKDTPDGKALNTIIAAIGNASDRACELVLNHEENIAGDDKEAQDLLAALNGFRNYLAPKKDPQTNKTIPIKTGKHFNMQLLVEAFKLYDQNYDTRTFGGWDSHKNNLCWRKVIGFMQRLLPACTAQASSQGIYYIVEEKEKLRRSFDFRYGGGSYFPLDSDANFRLGYNFAAGWCGDWGRRAERWAGVGKLCQAKTAGVQRIMQQPCNQSKSKCLVM